MVVRVDPEGNETDALFGIANLKDRHVLEVGSGDGRLTWRFAGWAGHVTGIEPYGPSVEKAKHNLPPELKGRVEFFSIGFDDFAKTTSSETYDTVLLSWTLC